MQDKNYEFDLLQCDESLTAPKGQQFLGFDRYALPIFRDVSSLEDAATHAHQTCVNDFMDRQNLGHLWATEDKQEKVPATMGENRTELAT